MDHWVLCPTVLSDYSTVVKGKSSYSAVFHSLECQERPHRLTFWLKLLCLCAVECTSGTFLNDTTGMCQLCPVGSYTDTDRQTQCTPCTAGLTTLQEGSTSCTSKLTSNDDLTAWGSRGYWTDWVKQALLELFVLKHFRYVEKKMLCHRS